MSLGSDLWKHTQENKSKSIKAGELIKGVQDARYWGGEGGQLVLSCCRTPGDKRVYTGHSVECASELLQTRGIRPLTVHLSLAENGFLGDNVSDTSALASENPAYSCSCAVTNIFHKQL